MRENIDKNNSEYGPFSRSDIGLYSDKSLAILKNTIDPEAEKLKKKFQKLFKE